MMEALQDAMMAKSTSGALPPTWKMSGPLSSLLSCSLRLNKSECSFNAESVMLTHWTYVMLKVGGWTRVITVEMLKIEVLCQGPSTPSPTKVMLDLVPSKRDDEQKWSVEPCTQSPNYRYQVAKNSTSTHTKRLGPSHITLANKQKVRKHCKKLPAPSHAIVAKKNRKKTTTLQKIPAPSHIITQHKEHSFCVFFPEVFHPWREWILVTNKWQTSSMCLERVDSLFQI